MKIELQKTKVDSININLSIEEYALIQALIGKTESLNCNVGNLLWSIYDNMCKITGGPRYFLTGKITIDIKNEKMNEEVERIKNL